MTPHVDYLLRLGDSSLVLGQRLAEWCGHGPVLEEDIAMTNVSLDFLGQARLLLTHAGTLEAAGRDEDALAYLRDARAFRNYTLCELPNSGIEKGRGQAADYAFTVMRNLLSNAEKYSLRDTTIINRIEIEDDFLRVSVLDRGFGFGDDEAEKIFEPFYRSPVVATRASGIGIGLVVCKRLVESHGGHMWARLREGGGSDIGFALPYTHPGADEDA